MIKESGEAIFVSKIYPYGYREKTFNVNFYFPMSLALKDEHIQPVITALLNFKSDTFESEITSMIKGEVPLIKELADFKEIVNDDKLFEATILRNIKNNNMKEGDKVKWEVMGVMGIGTILKIVDNYCYIDTCAYRVYLHQIYKI